jgi:hypothetical protein
MWGRQTSQRPARLSPADLAEVAANTAATSDQDDAADYHEGTPYGGTAWWERADTDDDSDGT